MTEKEFILMAADATGHDPAGIGMNDLLVADTGFNSLSLLLFFLKVENATGKKYLPLPYVNLHEMRLKDLWKILCEQGENKT